MEWTEHQACVQALERGRAALTKTSEDMARVIEALTPGVGEAALGNLHQVFTATAIADRVLASYTNNAPRDRWGSDDHLLHRLIISEVIGYGSNCYCRKNPCECEAPTLGERLTQAIDDAIDADREARRGR